MLVGANLEPGEFRDLHNGVCKITHLVSNLENTLSAELIRQFREGLDLINQAVERSREIEEALDDANRDYVDRTAILHQFKSVWSLDQKIDFKDPHGFPVVFMAYDNHWGEKVSSVTIPGDTWLDLWRSAEELIKFSGDTHHIFIEAFEVSKTQPDTLILSTGS
jgi:hypothetical protein